MQRNLAYTSVWVVVFSGMAYAQGLGDHHTGHSVKFWQQACQDDRRNACRVLGGIESRYCVQGSGWACNESGILMAQGRLADNTHAAEAFTRACTLRLAAGCQNASLPPTGKGARHGAPSNVDFALILREGKGALPDTTEEQLLDRACRQGWADGCGRLGVAYASGRGLTQDWPRAAALFKQACDGGDAGSCSNLGLMYKRGDGVKQDDVKATGLLQQACDLGMADACRWLAEQARPAVSQR